MKKSAIVLFCTACLASASLFAQSIQEGVNDLYAERNQSAKAIFEKLAANPKSIEASYWLGQTYIENNDIPGARSVYEKALAANPNAPLLLAGLGHVELLENKPQDARQHFDAALTASHTKKGDDPMLLNAVGRANVDAKAGDAAYAISKLSAAAQLAPTNPDIALNLGNAYRKAHEGGNAVQAYTKAGTFAPAIYRMAMLYKTQNNWDVVLENLNRAIQADPKFAPAYEQLYDYYLRYKRDYTQAEQYANKYVSSSDPSVENDYMLAQTKWVQNNFTDAINIAKNIITKTNNNPKARVYRLLGYSYLSNKDTATACQYVGQFFSKAKDDEIVGQDYILQADACGKDNPDIIAQSYLKAVEGDTLMSNKLKFLQEGIDRAKASGQKTNEAALRLAAYNLRPDHNPAELFQIALPYYQGGKYQRADSLFTAYTVVFPDSIYGYYWSALAKSQIDTTMSQGLAVPAFQKALDIAQKDPARFKSQGIQSSGYLAGYYNNVKNDKATAISYLQKGLAFDPTNASLQSSLQSLQRSAAAPAKTKTVQKGAATKAKTKG